MQHFTTISTARLLDDIYGQDKKVREYAKTAVATLRHSVITFHLVRAIKWVSPHKLSEGLSANAFKKVAAKAPQFFSFPRLIPLWWYLPMDPTCRRTSWRRPMIAGFHHDDDDDDDDDDDVAAARGEDHDDQTDDDFWNEPCSQCIEAISFFVHLHTIWNSLDVRLSSTQVFDRSISQPFEWSGFQGFSRNKRWIFFRIHESFM